MKWQMYIATYELRSPLHIGYHKVGNLQRTRTYIPARNLWGAVTEALTRRGFYTTGAPLGDYQKIGEWVKAHCAFGYWFIWENDAPLCPHYEGNRLKYGPLTATELERRYLDAHVTTALDAATTSAQAGSLHEVEFIMPYNREGVRTQVSGWVFLEETARSLLGTESKWRAFLETLQVGGERRYGFGQLRLTELELKAKSNLEKLEWMLDAGRPCIEVLPGCPLLAHTLITGVEARGDIEPLVGRETHNSHTFGRVLTSSRVCWTPGSVLTSPARLEIHQDGYWRHTAQ
jgi:hypothetical protein